MIEYRNIYDQYMYLQWVLDTHRRLRASREDSKDVECFTQIENERIPNPRGASDFCTRTKFGCYFVRIASSACRGHYLVLQWLLSFQPIQLAGIITNY